MMLSLWMLVVGGAVALQFVLGLGLSIAGLVMTVGQSRMGPSETRWPLSRKLVTAGGVLMTLAALESIGLFAAVAFSASNERFA